MAIDPTGAWLVEALPSSNSVVLQATPISTVGASTASTTTPIETAPLTGTTVKQIAFSPDGKNIFLALGDGGFAVVPFTVANTTSTPFGTAVYKGVYASGGAAVSIAVDPKSRLYYVGEVAALSGTSNTGGLRVFSYSALPTITEITTTPLSSGGLAPSAILPESSGAYVYVANGNGTSAGSISVFDFSSSGTTYSLTTTSLSTATGITPAGLAEESSNTYLLLVDSSGGPDLNAFTFSSSTGALTSAFTSTTGTDPVEAVAITATP
jgi:6-phosphogluconolactonase (cycloisomerase 2 family)